VNAADDPAPPFLKIGDRAPDIHLEGLLQAPEGAKVTLEALKGNIVVLEFWATWCGPCIGAIPHMNELVDKFADKPVRFISITDEEKSVIEPFLKKRPMKGWVGLDTDRSVIKAFKAFGVPRTIILDANGALVANTHPNMVTESVLNDILAGRKLGAAFDEPDIDSSKVEPSAVEHPPLYEVSIRPSALEGLGFSWGPTEYKGMGWTLLNLASSIYEMPERRIDISPELMEQKYDLTVIVPEGQQDSLRPLARQAFQSAFPLDVRREAPETEVFVLTAPRGPGVGLRPTAATGRSTFHSTQNGQLVAVNKDLPMMAEIFEGILGKQVVIEAKLEGHFDFELSYGQNQPDLMIKAVREQLGLELRPDKRPVEVLVVRKKSPN